jgi:hypothetical protein
LFSVCFGQIFSLASLSPTLPGSSCSVEKTQ